MADHLAESVDTLVAETQKLRGEVREEKFWRRLFLALFVLFVFAWAWTARYQVDTARQNKENGRVLIECTTAGTKADPHPCFDRGQATTGKAVGAIVTQIQAAADEVICELSVRAAQLHDQPVDPNTDCEPKEK